MLPQLLMSFVFLPQLIKLISPLPHSLLPKPVLNPVTRIALGPLLGVLLHQVAEEEHPQAGEVVRPPQFPLAQVSAAGAMASPLL